MPYIWELPTHPGPFPWSNIVPASSEAGGSFGFTHQKLAENYTGDLRVLPAVTAFVGGGSTALDGLATAAGATTTLAIREVVLGRAVYRYQLLNGSDAESVPEVIRPDDYDAGSNQRVWRLVVPANRNPVAGVPGVAGSFTMDVTGCGLATDPWSMWVRLYVNSRAVNTASLISLSNAGTGAAVTVDVTSGSLVLTAKSATGVTEATATSSGFVARYADAVVDLVLVRVPTSNPSNHDVQLWVNAELVLTVTISSARNYGFTACAPLATNSPEWAVYRATLFNRALSSGDIYRLALQGIEAVSRWGSPSVGYTADFSAGTDSWSALGGGTLAGNLDGLGIPSTDNVLRYTVPASPTGAQAAGKLLSSVFSVGYRLLRVRGKVWLPTTNTGADEVRLSMTSDPYYVDSVRLAGRTAGWVDIDVVLPCREATVRPYFHMAFAAGSGTAIATDTLHLADLTVQQVGALMDADLSFGVGRKVIDRSPNGFHSANSGMGTNTVWTVPPTHGQKSYTVNLPHSAISSSAGSGVLLSLPPNAALLRVELERTVAFDSGITVSIGTSGDDDRYVAATAVDTVGATLASSLVQTVESATAHTTIYPRKSGSTTVGNLRVRVIYELRGSPPPVA